MFIAIIAFIVATWVGLGAAYAFKELRNLQRRIGFLTLMDLVEAVFHLLFGPYLLIGECWGWLEQKLNNTRIFVAKDRYK